MSNTIKIRVGATKAMFLGDYPKKVVDELTSAPINGFQFAPSFKAKRWDGKRHLLNKYQHSFPVGLTTKVVDSLRALKYKVDIEFDKNLLSALPAVLQMPIDVPDELGTITLRDYQKEAIETYLDPDTTHPYVGILKIATAGGKTVTSAAVAKLLNVKTLFLVRGKALKDQTYDVYNLIFQNEDVGKIDSKNWSPDKYTVASVDTLYSRLKNEDECEKVKAFLSTIQFLIVDEAHTATSASFMAVLNCIQASMRMGLSGTPNKKEPEKDLLLEAFCGPIIYNLTTSTLQNIGQVARATLSSIIIDEPKLNALDYNEAKDILIINNTSRTNIIADVVADRYTKGKTIMVMAGNSVPLAQNLHNAIKSKISKPEEAAFVYGQTDGEVIKDALECLREGRLKILTTTVIMDTGIDVPAIDCIFIANGGKSFVKTIQRIGRGLRKKLDGSLLETVDVFDATNPYLLAHSKKRLKYYEEEDIFDSATVIEVKKKE